MSETVPPTAPLGHSSPTVSEVPPTNTDPCATRDAVSIPETVHPDDVDRGIGLAVSERTISGYTLEAVLGRGGMGVVYRARQPGLGRVVALKMILHAEHADEEERRRFRAEAEALARLRHPNIVQVYEVGEHNGLPYFSLEYVEGGSLDRFLAGTPQPAIDSAALVEKLAQAVQAAHDVGIIHRDLKPANVLLTFSREPAARVDPPHAAGTRLNEVTPRITDFGLARNLVESQQTPTGAVLGTPSYMAPEQASGQVHAIGPATDVYALGAILYECLTGRPPFKGATLAETLRQVAEVEPVSPRQLQPGVPRDLETICLKCLQKSSARRYGSARELADDLGRFIRGEPILARPIGWLERLGKWARRQPVVAALVAILAIIIPTALAGVSWMWAQERTARRDAETAEREKSELADERGVALREAKGALYLRDVEAGQHSFLNHDTARAFYHLDRCEPKLRRWEWHYLRSQFDASLETWAPDQVPFTSLTACPDGMLLGLSGESRNTTARVWDPVGKRLLWSVQEETLGVSRSPDGSHLALEVTEGKFVIVDAAGKKLRTLTAPPDHVPVHPVGALAPGGRLFAAGSMNGELLLWDVFSGPNGRVLAVLGGEPGTMYNLVFSPDGKLLASAGYGEIRVWSITPNASEAELRRSVVSLDAAKGRTRALAFSPDGKALVSGGTDRAVRLWDLQQRAGQTLYRHAAEVTTLAFSRDGKRLASGGDDQTILVWDLARKTAFGLRGHRAPIVSVAFSPDGMRLYSTDSDTLAVKVWDATRDPTLPLQMPGERVPNTEAFTFHPTEPLVAYGNNRTVRILNRLTGKEVHVLRGHVVKTSSAAFSRDGRRVAVDTSLSEIHVWDLTTGRRVCTLPADPLGAVLALHPSGTKLATAVGSTIRLWDLPGGVEAVKLSAPSAIGDLAFSPDGGTLMGRTGGEVVAWESTTGKQRFAVSSLPLDRKIIFSPNGAHVVLRDLPTAFQVRDSRTGKVVYSEPRDQDAVQDAVFSPDGTRLLLRRVNDVQIREFPSCRVQCSIKEDTFSPHTAAFTTDGRSILLGGSNGWVKQLSVSTGEVQRTWRAHAAAPDWLMALSDGRHLLTAGEDSFLRTWDLADGRLVTACRCAGRTRTVIEGKPLRVAVVDSQGVSVIDPGTGEEGSRVCSLTMGPNLAFLPDGNRLITGGTHGRFHIWDTSTWQPIGTITEPGGSTVRLTVAGDGRLVVTGRDLSVWDPDSGRRVSHVPGYKVTGGAALSADGTRLATPCDDGRIRVWDVAARQVVVTLEGSCGRDPILVWVPDGTRLAGTPGREGRSLDEADIFLWDATTGKQQRRLQGHTGWLTGLAISRDGRRLASSSTDRTVKVWDVESGRESRSFSIEVTGPVSFALAPDGQQLALAAHRDVQVRDVDSGVTRLVLRGHTLDVRCVVYSPDGHRLASGGSDHTVRLWDLGTGKEAVPARQLAFPVRELAFTGDGGQLLAAAYPYAVRRVGEGSTEVKGFSTTTGQETVSLRLAKEWARRVGFSEDGRRLAVSRYGGVLMWDARANREESDITGYEVGSAAAVHPDGRWLATGTTAGRVRVFELPSGEERENHGVHNGPIGSLAFSADGRWLASGMDRSDRPAEVALWEWKTRKPVLRHRAANPYTSATVAFTPDSTRLAANLGGEGGGSDMILWDVDMREQALAFSWPIFLRGLAFSPDGRQLASINRNEGVIFWDGSPR